MKTPAFPLVASLIAGVAFAPLHALASESAAAEQAALRSDIQNVITDLKADAQNIKADAQNSDGWNRGDRHSQATGGAPVPEPSTWILMGGLGLGVAWLATRERKGLRA